MTETEWVKAHEVLIPLNSGQVFCLLRPAIAHTDVLIPLNSGQVFCPTKLAQAVGGSVLIPLNSGQVFCQKADRFLNLYISLNPFEFRAGILSVEAAGFLNLKVS